MENFIRSNKFILSEGAVIERLRRDETVELHPRLVNAPLIYSEHGRNAMSKIYREYIEIAQQAQLPFVMCSPTWRANHERVYSENCNPKINRDAISFLVNIRDEFGTYADQIKIGGLVGCKNDCYLPDEALEINDAKEFHSWQINELVAGGVDFLIAETLPSVKEAIGIALAMSEMKIPYIISFVIDRFGRVLDGTDLTDAIQKIDRFVSNRPLGYTVSCSYPTFICSEKRSGAFWQRFIGCHANASSLDHSELDEATEIKNDPVADWGEAMLELNEHFGVQIMGGCCGTTSEHLNYLIHNREGRQ